MSPFALPSMPVTGMSPVPGVESPAELVVRNARAFTGDRAKPLRQHRPDPSALRPAATAAPAAGGPPQKEDRT